MVPDTTIIAELAEPAEHRLRSARSALISVVEQLLFVTGVYLLAFAISTA
jgi:hypothetical protein